MSNPPGGEKQKRWTESSLTISHLIPLASKSRASLGQAFVVPVALTVLAVVILFGAESPATYALTLAAWLCFLCLYFIYSLCGKPKPWWWLAAAAGFMIALFFVPDVWPSIAYVFRELLPGSKPIPEDGFLERFVKSFFGAGMAEELFKAIPIVSAIWLGRQLKSPWREKLGVWEPLDGVLIGAASGIGFTLFETFSQYVPEELARYASAADTLMGPLVADDLRLELSQAVGSLYALQLLIPRILGQISGHVAYSGYFGYFFGLAVLKPKRAVELLIVGYLTSALLHGLWNASGSDGMALLVGVTSYAFLAAAILKARQLSPDSAERPEIQPAAIQEQPRPEPKPRPVIEPAPAPRPAAGSVHVRVGATSIYLAAGETLAEGRVRGLKSAAGDGIVAEVVRNPKNPTLLGLKNHSKTAWMAVLGPADERAVNPGRSVKLSTGVKIRFGAIDAEVL